MDTKIRFQGESEQFPEARRWPPAGPNEVYYINLLLFYEDDMQPFLSRFSSIPWAVLFVSRGLFQLLSAGG